MRKVKTSVSIKRETLRRIKREAKRQKRSVSNLVELWIEQLPSNGKAAA